MLQYFKTSETTQAKTEQILIGKSFSITVSCLKIQTRVTNVIQSQLGMLNGGGLPLWPKPTGCQANILSAHCRGGSACRRIYRKPWWILGQHERLNGSTCSHQSTTNHPGFCSRLSWMCDPPPLGPLRACTQRIQTRIQTHVDAY